MTPLPPQVPRSWRGWAAVNREWIGGQTIAAAVVGAACAAVVSWVVLSFVNPWSTDSLLSSARSAVSAAEEAEQAAEQQAYDDAWGEALARAVARERVATLGALVVDARAGDDAPWAVGFREGWADGWNDALDAMRAAAMASGVALGATDFRLLDGTPRREAQRGGG